MMKRAQSGAADVHAGTLTNRFKTLEDLDRIAVVFAVASGCEIDRFRGVGHSRSSPDLKEPDTSPNSIESFTKNPASKTKSVVF